MTQSKHGDTQIPFGKYRGRTIDQVAKSDAGLRYLDWLRGVAEKTWLKDALDGYLNDPAMARELDRLIDTDEEG